MIQFFSFYLGKKGPQRRLGTRDNLILIAEDYIKRSFKRPRHGINKCYVVRHVEQNGSSSKFHFSAGLSQASDLMGAVRQARRCGPGVAMRCLTVGRPDGAWAEAGRELAVDHHKPPVFMAHGLGLRQTTKSPPPKDTCLFKGLFFWCRPGPPRPLSGWGMERLSPHHPMDGRDCLWSTLTCSEGRASKCPEAALLEWPIMGCSGIAASWHPLIHPLECRIQISLILIKLILSPH